MNVQLIESVKNAVEYIINNEKYETTPDIDVVQGCEMGDGYASTTYAISINGKNGKTNQLFAKCFPDKRKSESKDQIARAFQTEVNFYKQVYPAFCSFQERRNIKEPFNNVPKYYSINSNDVSPIVLENLKSLGYTLRDMKKPVDDDHLKLPIGAFARYHAISYAMKDQEPAEFEKLSSNIVDLFADNFIEFEMDDMISTCIDQFRSSLEPDSDKKLLDHCGNLAEVLIQHTLNVPQNVDEYAVIGQGDCWSNNMMFLYDNSNGSPKEIKLIDWQGTRVNSPLLDFSYFFYTVATKEVLNNAEYYLNFYYETLSKRIKELGSNPEKMYPKKIFIEHWRKFALFGLTMAFFSVKSQLFEKYEIPDLINTTFTIVIKHQDKYVTRIRDLVEYFIDKGLL